MHLECLYSAAPSAHSAKTSKKCFHLVPFAVFWHKLELILASESRCFSSYGTVSFIDKFNNLFE